MSRTTRSVLGPIVAIAVVVVTFARVNEPFRFIEAKIAANLLKFCFPGLEAMTIHNEIVVQPRGSVFFVAQLIPSCSALASILTVACLALVTPRRRYSMGRKALAVGMAVAIVAVGNMVRIVASLAAGVLGGTQALILFHDGAGAFFSFVAILVGYTSYLAILMPKRAPASSRSEEIHRVSA